MNNNYTQTNLNAILGEVLKRITKFVNHKTYVSIQKKSQKNQKCYSHRTQNRTFDRPQWYVELYFLVNYLYR